MPFPKLPANAAYIRLSNPAKRNALSLSILQDLKRQLTEALTSPVSGQLRVLPPFQSKILSDLEKVVRREDTTSEQWKEYGWLVKSSEWKKERAGLPNVLVLRSEGPVFSSGHDLKELTTLSHDEVKLLFSLCAEVMSLIRRSPALVVCPIQGLATAAGFQLAMAADYPIALPDAKFCLPGAKIGLPCTSPSTAVSRRLPPGATYRLLATAEPVSAGDFPGAVDVVRVAAGEEPGDAFEKRVSSIVEQLAAMAPQQQAVGKWAYLTQLGIKESDTDQGGDGFEAAARWAGRVMALHARSEDAKEGIAAFVEKRSPAWVSRST
ncbi:xylan -beta-xylosidase [Fusarium albosuccineum]|uniref:Enoyl-CoA hydratase domain-containing protein 3, mitochondrial n=1 Tax=Fusarium albosuccineum TaxID=1237068 RepID=A0A8H4PDP2_9HYPO|nr:xylan -beta-xylosidase [Fusarium albosuccineum]